MFNPKKKIKNSSLSKIVLSKENIIILIKYPKALDKKYVCIPNIDIPTNPLIRPKYFAPTIPAEDLNITTNGKPNFWDGLPIKLENK